MEVIFRKIESSRCYLSLVIVFLFLLLLKDVLSAYVWFLSCWCLNLRHLNGFIFTRILERERCGCFILYITQKIIYVCCWGSLLNSYLVILILLTFLKKMLFRYKRTFIAEHFASHTVVKWITFPFFKNHIKPKLSLLQFMRHSFFLSHRKCESKFKSETTFLENGLFTLPGTLSYR